jgi:virginiamycin B lyase
MNPYEPDASQTAPSQSQGTTLPQTTRTMPTMPLGPSRRSQLILVGSSIVILVALVSVAIIGSIGRPASTGNGGSGARGGSTTIAATPTATAPPTVTPTPVSPLATLANGVQVRMLSLPGTLPISAMTLGSDQSLWVAGANIAHITSPSAGLLTATPYAIPPLPFNAEPPISDITLGPDSNIWFTTPAYIGRLGTDVTGAGIPLGTATAFPFNDANHIIAGPDGNLWFTGTNSDLVGRITPAGKITTFPLPAAFVTPGDVMDIVVGPDHNLWFTAPFAHQIGRITPAGSMAFFAAEYQDAHPQQLVSGPDGNLWCIEGGKPAQYGSSIWRITPTGMLTHYPIQVNNDNAEDLEVGPDGNLWYTTIGTIGRITPSGVIKTFAVNGLPRNLASASGHGALWFNESGSTSIGTITTAGQVATYPLPGAAALGSAIILNSNIISDANGTIWIAETDGTHVWQLVYPARGT